MTALLTLALGLGLAAPLPQAYVDNGSARVPLAISSWCRGNRCGAPIAASKHVVKRHRGQLVRCVLGFTPTNVRVNVGGAPVTVDAHGDEIDWRATRGGGITVTASSRGLWVTYVGRLVVR